MNKFINILLPENVTDKENTMSLYFIKLKNNQHNWSEQYKTLNYLLIFADLVLMKQLTLFMNRTIN